MVEMAIIAVDRDQRYILDYQRYVNSQIGTYRSLLCQKNTRLKSLRRGMGFKSSKQVGTV